MSVDCVVRLLTSIMKDKIIMDFGVSIPSSIMKLNVYGLCYCHTEQYNERLHIMDCVVSKLTSIMKNYILWTVLSLN